MKNVQYQEVEEPKVTPGHVKIKVRYSGICGSDIPRVLNHGVHFYPIVLGHESPVMLWKSEKVLQR